MGIVLGIDTGGTYTDAALVDHASGRVLFSAKSLTTYEDLSKGIAGAVDGVLKNPGAPDPSQIGLVGLSTTLATNAIVEGRSGRVGLILIGYDEDMIQNRGLKDDLAANDPIYIDGGHDPMGEQIAELDTDSLHRAVKDMSDRVDAFGVSSYFSVRNPAHELEAELIIRNLTGLPVTCGHQLTSRLDSIRRAATVALNAGLIPIIEDLIDRVALVLKDRDVSASLMVVKGDGSLVKASWAARRPVETILSGPAASVVGANHLAGGDGRSQWVVDMGGTTTDIAFLSDGRPRLNREGARVGRWQTMVEAVDVRTAGLGGDSRVRLDRFHNLTLGPERITPISRLAADHPDIIDELQRQKVLRPRGEMVGLFMMRRASIDDPDVPTGLKEKPMSWRMLIDRDGPTAALPAAVDRAVKRDLIGLAGFTPTDALHALGDMDIWNADAARLAAQVLIGNSDMSVEEFCRQVVERVGIDAATELVSASLTGQGLEPDWAHQPVAAYLLDSALKSQSAENTDLTCSLTLNHPVAAIGAPVPAYMHQAARRLNARLTIPNYADVANAVGAVVGGVVLSLSARVVPLEGTDLFRVYLPDGVVDHEDKDEAIRFCVDTASEMLVSQAKQAGGVEPDIRVGRHDRTISLGSVKEDAMYLGTDFTFTAVGRPDMTG